MEAKNKGICKNFGNCKNADNKLPIEVDISADFVCPECEQDLVAIEKKSLPIKKMSFLIGGLAVLGIIVWLVISLFSGKEPPPPSITTHDSKNKPPTNSPTAVNPEKVVIDGINTVYEGKTIQLNAKVVPSAANQEVTWSSSDENIAKVNESGEITGIKGSSKGKTVYIIANSKTSVNISSEKFTLTVLTKEEQGDGIITIEGGNKFKGKLKNGQLNGLGTLYYKSRQLISPKDKKQRYAESGDYIIGEWYDGNLVYGKLFGSDNVQKEAIMIGR